jgi:hypothetical protein
MKKVPYQSVIGSLMYCVTYSTRLDIAYLVGIILQFITNPSEIH